MSADPELLEAASDAARRRTSPSAVGEAALMARVALGDQRSFAEVYERHSDLARSIAVGLCGSSGDDVVQDVFLRLWRVPEGFDAARGGLQTYIVMKVRGRAVDVLRSSASRRDREHLLASARARIDRSEPTSTGRSEDLITAHLLRTLTTVQREAIVLAYYGGHSYQEVARLLDRPEGTVKGHIRSGLRRLRVELASTGDAPALRRPDPEAQGPDGPPD